jgi:hypothetical protein
LSRKLTPKKQVTSNNKRRFFQRNDGKLFVDIHKYTAHLLLLESASLPFRADFWPWTARATDLMRLGPPGEPGVFIVKITDNH